jgi:hypothetical protein
MTKNKIPVIVGTCALALVSVLAVSATKKRTTIASLYYLAGATCTTISNSSVFTTAGTGSTITFRNDAGATETVYSASSCAAGTAVNVYLK